MAQAKDKEMAQAKDKLHHKIWQNEGSNRQLKPSL